MLVWVCVFIVTHQLILYTKTGCISHAGIGELYIYIYNIITHTYTHTETCEHTQMKNERVILWHIPAVVCVMLEGFGRPFLAQGGSTGLEE